MFSERFLRGFAVVAVVAALLVIGAVLSVLRTPSGFQRTQAVVQDLRVLDAPTDSWRPYDRDRRFEVLLSWTRGTEARSGWTEVSPFEQGHLRRGERIPAFVRDGPPPEVRAAPQSVSEIFLVVLGLLTFIGLFVSIAIGRKLEARNAPA